jgi:hypothetical protein
VLVECGLVRVTAGDGTGATFRPSLERIASLGTPSGIVELYARLYGPNAEAAAADVLAGLCDPEDAEALPALIGEPVAAPQGVRWAGGAIPDEERLVLARHLMQHGMVGKAKPGATRNAERGSFSPTFDAGEYIAAAVVHLGMSEADAADLSMTAFQQRFEMKFPEQAKGPSDVPTREEYEAGMRAFEELKARRAAGKAEDG